MENSSSDGPLTSSQRLIVAHGLLCALGFLLFLPAGALLARYFRVFTPKWFKGHWILQFAVAGPIIVIGVSIGFSIGKKGDHTDDAHKNIGNALFFLYIFQCILGGLIHRIKLNKFNGRPPQNYLHAILRLLILSLALYQVRTGYKIAWPHLTGRGYLDNGVDAVWWSWVILVPVLYLAGLALLARQLEQEQTSRVNATRDRFESSGLEDHRCRLEPL